MLEFRSGENQQAFFVLVPVPKVWSIKVSRDFQYHDEIKRTVITGLKDK